MSLLPDTGPVLPGAGPRGTSARVTSRGYAEDRSPQTQ